MFAVGVGVYVCVCACVRYCVYVCVYTRGGGKCVDGWVCVGSVSVSSARKCV